MMEPVIAGPRGSHRHRLNALALARSDQTRDVERTHAPTGLVAQVAQKRSQPALKILLPIHMSIRRHRFAPEMKLAAANLPNPLICQGSVGWWRLRKRTGDRRENDMSRGPERAGRSR